MDSQTERIRIETRSLIREAVQMREKCIQNRELLRAQLRRIMNRRSSSLRGGPTVPKGDLCMMLTDVLDDAMWVTSADMGNIQLFNSAVGALQIEAQRGFRAPFLAYFDRVHAGEAVCGMALKHAERVIVPDVAESPIFLGTSALEVVLDAGARGVQSTPLVGSSGRLQGVLSTHYRRPRRPNEREVYRLDLLARRLVQLIERDIRPPVDGFDLSPAVHATPL
jgi:hypothetical protein